MSSDRPSGWRSATLGEFSPFSYGKGLSAKSREQGSVPVFSSAGFIDRHSSALCDTAGVIIGRKGTIGTVYRSDSAFWPIDTTFFVEDSAERDGSFTYWLLKSLEPAFQGMNSDSAVPGLNRDAVHSVRVLVPSLPEQRAIASVLGALDEKIESNRRVAAATAEIFLSHAWHLIWTAGGNGATVPLGNLLRQSREKETDETLPYIGLDQMPRGSTILSERLSGDAPKTSTAFDEGAILFGKLRPYFRKVGVAPTRGRCSTEIVVLHPTSPENYGVGLAAVASQAFIDHCTAISTGTRMPRAEWANASEFEVPVLEPSVREELTGMACATYAMTRGLMSEAETLTKVRDTLLPKLVSGRLRVHDIEDFAEETVAA